MELGNLMEMKMKMKMKEGGVFSMACGLVQQKVLLFYSNKGLGLGLGFRLGLEGMMRLKLLLSDNPCLIFNI